jgi:hypothetical protein
MTTATFAKRHAVAAFHEGYVFDELGLRGWEVIDERLEQRLSPHGVEVLNKIGGNMCGADCLAVGPGSAWLIDAKCYTGRSQCLPGLGKYHISVRSLVAMETNARLRQLPGLFVLGDLFVVTPAEVRDYGYRPGRGRSNFYIISSSVGRSFDQVFGDPQDGFPIAAPPSWDGILRAA